MGSKKIINYPEILHEDVIEIGKASQCIPGHPSRSVLEKWLREGLLESALVGKKRFVSRQSIERMLARMNENEGKEYFHDIVQSEKKEQELSRYVKAGIEEFGFTKSANS